VKVAKQKQREAEKASKKLMTHEEKVAKKRKRQATRELKQRFKAAKVGRSPPLDVVDSESEGSESDEEEEERGTDSKVSKKREACRNAEMHTEFFRTRFYPGYQMGEGYRRLGKELAMITQKEYFNEAQGQKEQEEYYSQLSAEGGLRDGLEFGTRNFNLLSKLVSYKTPKARIDNLYSWYDRQPDGTLECIYSKKVLSDAMGNYPRGSKFNEEHSFPQSWQHGAGVGTGRDAHHIFACDQHLNGSRGNKAFGIVEGR